MSPTALGLSGVRMMMFRESVLADSEHSFFAEGHGRSTRGECLHHISIARGSAIEVEIQLLVAERLGYTDIEPLAVARERCDSICRMLTQLKRSLAATRRLPP
jgi:four helix bundle protein